jgi:hypothetical protein
VSKADVIAVILIAAVVWVIHVEKRPAPAVGGDTPVPTTTHFNAFATPEQPDGDLTLSWTTRDENGSTVHHSASADVRHGRVYQSDVQRKASDAEGLTLHYDHTISFADSNNLDIGTVAGFAGLSSLSRFQVGIRYSPCRLFFGTVAPDALITRDAVGLGVSVYLPPSAYPELSHFGLEVGRLVPTHASTKPANFIGGAFSIYDP